MERNERFRFLDVFEHHIAPIRIELHRLRASFFGRDPAPVSVNPLAGGFWLESIKKDKAAQLRHSTLGAQAWGLHAELREACIEQDHLQLAIQTPHPIVAAQQALEPAWANVFAIARGIPPFWG